MARVEPVGSGSPRSHRLRRSKRAIRAVRHDSTRPSTIPAWPFPRSSPRDPPHAPAPASLTSGGSDSDDPLVRAWRLGAFSLSFLLMAAAAVVLALALARLRVIVVPAIAAVFLAALLIHPTGWLRSRGVPATVASLLVVVGFVMALAGTLALMVPRVAGEFANLQTGVSDGLRQVGTWLTEGPLGLSPGSVDRAVERGLAAVGLGGPRAPAVLSGALLAGEVLAAMVLTVVLLFFFLRDGERMWRWLAGLFRGRRQRHVLDLGSRTWEALEAYLRGIAIVAVFDTISIGATLLLIGVPLVLPLMVLTFLGAFVPIVGAAAAGLVAVLIALVAKGPVAALLVLVAVATIQQIEGNLLYPVVVGRRIHLHPVATLVAFGVGATVAGVLGALLSVPVAAVIGTFADSRLDEGADELPPDPPPAGAPE